MTAYFSFRPVHALWFATLFYGLSCGNAQNENENNCRPPKGCPERHVCARGGCLPLIPEEPEVLWNTEIAAQTGENRDVWSPRPAFGDALLLTEHCNGIEKSMLEKQKGGALSTTRSINVYAFSSQDVKVLKQQKTSSSMWQDHVKFQFPRAGVTGTPTYCISDSLDAIKVLPNKVENGVEALLTEAAPANVPFTAAVMERRPLGAQAGARISYDIILTPVRTDDREDTSVLVIPLGTDILSLSGVVPVKQRLLKGYAAYYFNHGKTRDIVTVQMRLPTVPSPPLDFSQLKP